MQIDTTSMLIIGGISVIIGLISLLFILYRKKAKYDDAKHMALLEEVRNSFEKQIYALNDRLIQNQERWKDVNHLLITKAYLDSKINTEANKRVQYSEFLKVNGISENDLNIDNRLVFVLTPFHQDFASEFITIKNICEAVGFDCKRGDEKEFKGDIFPQVLRYLVRARLIIANVNGRSPNVLYELGVAQALDKAVILVSRDAKDLPVDIKSQRFLIYSSSNSLSDQLRTELQKYI